MWVVIQWSSTCLVSIKLCEFSPLNTKKIKICNWVLYLFSAILLDSFISPAFFVCEIVKGSYIPHEWKEMILHHVLLLDALFFAHLPCLEFTLLFWKDMAKVVILALLLILEYSSFTIECVMFTISFCAIVCFNVVFLISLWEFHTFT